MTKQSLNSLTRLSWRASLLPALVIVIAAASVGATTMTPSAIGAASPSRSDTEARAACAHRASGPELIGSEKLIEHGWTIGEKNGLIRALARFAQHVCLQSGYVSVEASTYRQKHVDNMTVWQDTFRVICLQSHYYWITVDLPNLDTMSVTIKATNGEVLYRSGTIETPEG